MSNCNACMAGKQAGEAHWRSAHVQRQLPLHCTIPAGCPGGKKNRRTDGGPQHARVAACQQARPASESVHGACGPTRRTDVARSPRNTLLGAVRYMLASATLLSRCLPTTRLTGAAPEQRSGVAHVVKAAGKPCPSIDPRSIPQENAVARRRRHRPPLSPLTTLNPLCGTLTSSESHGQPGGACRHAARRAVPWGDAAGAVRRRRAARLRCGRGERPGSDCAAGARYLCSEPLLRCCCTVHGARRAGEAASLPSCTVAGSALWR